MLPPRQSIQTSLPPSRSQSRTRSAGWEGRSARGAKGSRRGTLPPLQSTPGRCPPAEIPLRSRSVGPPDKRHLNQRLLPKSLFPFHADVQHFETKEKTPGFIGCPLPVSSPRYEDGMPSALCRITTAEGQPTRRSPAGSAAGPCAATAQPRKHPDAGTGVTRAAVEEPDKLQSVRQER